MHEPRNRTLADVLRHTARGVPDHAGGESVTTPIVPPTVPTPSAVEVGGFWFCAECPTVVVTTDHREAAKHFDDPEQWGHWLWEFTFPEGRYPYAPTGREIHTSDAGGYYISQPDSPHKPEDVWKDLARKFINGTLSKEHAR